MGRARRHRLRISSARLDDSSREHVPQPSTCPRQCSSSASSNRRTVAVSTGSPQGCLGALDGADADDDLEERIAGRELLRVEVGGGEPVEEAGGRQVVAVGLDMGVAGAERLLREPKRRAAGVVPPLAVLRVLGRRDLRNPGDGGEEEFAGGEDAVRRASAARTS